MAIKAKFIRASRNKTRKRSRVLIKLVINCNLPFNLNQSWCSLISKTWSYQENLEFPKKFQVCKKKLQVCKKNFKFVKKNFQSVWLKVLFRPQSARISQDLTAVLWALCQRFIYIINRGQSTDCTYCVCITVYMFITHSLTSKNRR